MNRRDDRNKLLFSEIELMSPHDIGIRIAASIPPDSDKIRNALLARDSNTLFDAYYNVLNIRPPYDNIGYHEQDENFPDRFGGLGRSHAIFKGIKRPCRYEDQDKRLFVYVSRQRYKYTYTADMVCRVKKVPTEPGLLFVGILDFGRVEGKGVILNWEWVQQDPEDPNLPIGYKDRYDERVYYDE